MANNNNDKQPPMLPPRPVRPPVNIDWQRALTEASNRSESPLSNAPTPKALSPPLAPTPIAATASAATGPPVLVPPPTPASTPVKPVPRGIQRQPASESALFQPNNNGGEELERLRRENIELVAENRALKELANNHQQLQRECHAQIERIRQLEQMVAQQTLNEQDSATTATTTTTASVANDYSFENVDITIPFTEDSPFFQKDLREAQKKADALGVHLKAISVASSEFAATGRQFSDACHKLGNALLVDWRDSELHPHPPTPTSSSSTNNTNNNDSDVAHTHKPHHHHHIRTGVADCTRPVAEMLQNFHQMVQHLVLSLETVLSFTDFRENNIKQCQVSQKALRHASEEMDACLMEYLGRRQTQKPSSYAWRKHKEPTEAEAVELLSKLRSRFELQRFDHLERLNHLHTVGIADLNELVCAALYAFVTFFHEGQYHTTTLRPEIDAIAATIKLQRQMYMRSEVERAAQREKLVRGLESGPDFRVGDAFPRPEDEADRGHEVVKLRGQELRVEKQGFLLKQSSSMKKDWKRRWFALHQGNLFYFRSSSDLKPQHVVNALICSVRPSKKDDLKFCFELISPQNDRTYMLQAESEADMRSWIQVFQNCTESLLSQQMATQPSRLERRPSFKVHENNKEMMLAELSELNPVCVDCSQPDPAWASINLGVMMCIECSGIHRSLGVHVSKVRSLTLDAWDEDLLQFMLQVGNDTVNRLYEHSPMPVEFPKPRPSSTRDVKDAYIRAKYVAKLFMADKELALRPMAELGALLHAAVRDNDAEQILRLLAHGADAQWRDENNHHRNAMHVAAEHDHAWLVEWLHQCGVKHQDVDDEGNTPLAVATINNATNATRLLQHKKQDSSNQ